MQHNGHLPFPRPGPECASFADLLPLLGVSELEEQTATRLQTHLATCAYCRVQQATYDRIDVVLRRAVAVPATLSLSPEDMMSLTNQEQQRPESLAPTAPAPLQSHLKLHPLRHTRRVVSLLSAMAAVLVVLVVVVGIVASRGSLPRGATSAHPGAASATASPTAPVAQATPYVSSANDILQAVQMFSSSDGWAVGGAYKLLNNAGTFSALVLHYTNGQWTRVATPTNADLGLRDAELLSVSMLSSDEGWAVGFGSLASSTSADGLFQPVLSSATFASPGSGPGGPGPVGVILHYSAGKWTRFSIISDAELYQVRMLSSTDGWIAGGGGWGTGQGNEQGTDQGATTSMLLHYNGSQWTTAQAPNVAGISSLDMRSASDGWATGTNTILHYDGNQWSVFQQLQGIAGVSMDSASDGWAVGYVSFPDNYTSAYNVVWHFNGSQWVRESLPSTVNYDAEIIGLCMDSASDGWAVGFGNGGKGQNRYALYLHYTNGQWTQMQGPGTANLKSVQMLSANEGWAVGVEGAIMHYLNGTWTPYHP